MAAINDLLQQIPDTALRERLEQEFSRLSKTKKFGLVFEEHIPECTPLYDVAIQRGNKVAKKGGKVDDFYTVLEINGEMATCLHKTTATRQNIPISELISVAQFGDPIFPSLIPIAKVENASDDNLWHTLIEADNYHALQLLEYLYHGEADCIYIDPPYNTGARDWKYNNNYVDINDIWRHSKWLSFMKRRLDLAIRLLKPSGILIITVDDYEMHHLRCLLEIPPLSSLIDLGVVVIRNNPGGRATTNGMAVNHEYAIFLGRSSEAKPGRLSRTESQIARYNVTDEISSFEWVNFRKHGAGSNRSDRPKQFFPIYVSGYDMRVPRMSWNDDTRMWEDIEPPHDGEVAVWPVNEIGIEKVWSWGVDRVSNNPDDFEVRHDKKKGILIYAKSRVPILEGRLPGTWWDNKLYSSNESGTKLLQKIFGGVSPFEFPKSIYAVLDALKAADVVSHQDALVIDFFAGSGTTLNAINLLNAADGGQRRCVLVTNNEVSDTNAKLLSSRGIFRGDKEWEKYGICRAVTWPRTEYSILGRRGDGSELTGEYFTGQVEEREVERTFVQLSFVEATAQLTTSKKKQIVALLGKSKLPQSLVMANSDFIVSAKHTASVLFDCAHVDEYLDALAGQDHITEFYIVTKEAATFNSVKDNIKEMLGPVIELVNLKRPMSAGFPANVEYFKLGFLDRYHVTLGQQFREILPLLWLKSGGVGKRPVLTGQDIPDMLLLPQNSFAVLIDETKYAAFISALEAVEKDIKIIYFVTNSEEAFQEMASGTKPPHTYQLYRDYIDNFVLGSRRDSL